jgi:site-specific DNA-methyltransferase (adenine-specific)
MSKTTDAAEPSAASLGSHSVIVGDCLEVLRAMPDSSVDLVLGSPPYECARTYGIEFKLKGQAWVDWMMERWAEFQRVSRGAVVMVVEGQTRGFRWTATPALLMADLHRRGFNLRKPPAFQRCGIPGSGGPDWFRNDYEFCVVTTRGGRLPWSDNTAMGHAPRWAPGGDPSYRMPNGRRVHKLHTKAGPSGKRQQGYNPPARANPGNVIACKVGGGLMGSRLAHENEAPYPESLAEFFIRSLCPPGGTVLDPFSGSGTTAAVALRHGRNAVSVDIRESQVNLTARRVSA